jgi:hypothetical protein
MRYIIFSGTPEEPIPLSHPLRESSEAYLRESVFPALRPLSDDEYVNGPAKLLSTAGRSSYVLDGEDVYWCIEGGAGLVVVKFSPNGSMASAELRSPNPEFGGRKATAEEIENFDEDAENPQYNLVFDAWDAQFDEEELEEWESVDDHTRSRFETALAHADRLGRETAEEYRHLS